MDGPLIPVLCLVIAAALGISVAIHNLRDDEGRQKRIEARRAFKKEKNARLKKFYNL